MPLDDDPRTAIVRVPRGDQLVDTMSRIRSWLDQQKIQTATFTTALDAAGYTFKIGFKNAEDASRFRLQFCEAA